MTSYTRSTSQVMSRPAVIIDEDGVGQELTDGTRREVKWTGLIEVSIVAISKEPTTGEIYFHLLSEDGTGLLIPYGRYGVELFDRMTLLPGFDMEVTLRA